MHSTMLSTRRIGARGACRLVDMGPASATANSASSASMAAHPQYHARQQVRTNYSSLIDPGSAASGGAGGGPGSRAPWQAEENIDIQKVTQTAIVSFAAYVHGLICFDMLIASEHMQRLCTACAKSFYLFIDTTFSVYSLMLLHIYPSILTDP